MYLVFVNLVCADLVNFDLIFIYIVHIDLVCVDLQDILMDFDWLMVPTSLHLAEFWF